MHVELLLHQTDHPAGGGNIKEFMTSGYQFDNNSVAMKVLDKMDFLDKTNILGYHSK
jgi:hypothetical protein